ncbi:hypothetical protein [Peribacillus frigoritolerans]|uniref:hypothetical protein n=1 Tax=Peribacillus frigoritolerans TaxID=450367 RepID=UPI0020C0A5CF|nr:hypothetical protein [Peribacillus frigoritolerans]MEE3951652.1 hypothetical protein [Peribacillus frigoritolerans]
MPTSLTTALTIIGSFGAASTAQIVSHVLTQNREDKKYKKECLQNLYSPIIFKVIDYIQSIERSPLNLVITSTNADYLFDNIMESIGNNLKYAEPELINIFHEIRDDYESQKSNSLSHLDEEYKMIMSDMRLTHKILLLNTFINEYIKINKLLKSNVNPITNKLRTPYFFCKFYLLVKDCSPMNPIKSDDILALYDLIDFVLLPVNNYLERIIKLRKEINIVTNTTAYKDTARVSAAYTDAYLFLYELADEFSILNQDRANEWKYMLERHQD